MPADSTDAHVHGFDALRIPFAEARSYTPGAATLVQLHEHLAGIGLRRVVLVQPSVYGSDNACLLDAMAQLGPEVARGIACLELETERPDSLLSLHRAGVRGIRLNFEVRQEQNLESVRLQLAAAARQIDPPGWCVSAPLVFHLHTALDLDPSQSVLDLSLWLAGAPMSFLEYGFPDRATVAAFEANRELIKARRRSDPA